MLSGSNSKANTSTSKSVSFASDTTLQPISSSDASSSSSPSAASSLSASSASRSRQKKVGLHHASSSTSRPLSFDASRSPVCQPPSPSPNVASSSTIVSRSKRTTSSPQTEFLRSSHRIGVSNATSQNRRSSSMVRVLLPCLLPRGLFRLSCESLQCWSCLRIQNCFIKYHLLLLCLYFVCSISYLGEFFCNAPVCFNNEPNQENEPKKKSIIDWNALSDSDEDNEGS